jgi:hypothetical protein
MRGIYNRLPEWMKQGHESITDNAHEWTLANLSTGRSFPTTAGDSYTATHAIVDEADLSPDLNALLRAVKPTIDNGGKLTLLSRADKTKPVSDFKRIYVAAKKGINGWKSIFLPWYVHPGRDIVWYVQQKIDIKSRTNSLDDLYEQYPATDLEALQPRTLDKRIPFEWLTNCYEEKTGNDLMGIPGLVVYESPVPYRSYVIGADPAEGNPNSDDSSSTVMDAETGEEVALLKGKIQPSTFTEYVEKLSYWYNNADVLVERNNHGHAVLLKMSEDGFSQIINGLDKKVGWMNTSKSKALMYSILTDNLRDRKVTIHSFSTYQQLSSIDGSTLKAPEGQYDDEATGFALACLGREILQGGTSEMKQVKIKGRPKVRNIQTMRVMRSAKRVVSDNVPSF